MQAKHKPAPKSSQLDLALETEGERPGPNDLLPWLERRCLHRPSGHNANPPASLRCGWSLDGEVWLSTFVVEGGTVEARRIAHELLDHGERVGLPAAPLLVEVRWPAGGLWRAYEWQDYGSVYVLLDAPTDGAQ